MMSGMRKAPPISMSSPRETIDFAASGKRVEQRSTAAALLFTIVASSAPVRARRARGRGRHARRACRTLRSNSRATASRMAATAASIAASAKAARPRLVCSTVPVRLNNGRRVDRSSAPRRAKLWTAMSSAAGAKPPPALSAARASSNAARTACVETARPIAQAGLLQETCSGPNQPRVDRAGGSISRRALEPQAPLFANPSAPIQSSHGSNTAAAPAKRIQHARTPAQPCCKRTVARRSDARKSLECGAHAVLRLNSLGSIAAIDEIAAPWPVARPIRSRQPAKAGSPGQSALIIGPCQIERRWPDDQ